VTTSTSPNLLSDLDIPEGTKGRLKDPSPRDDRPSYGGRDRTRGRDDRRRGHGDQGEEVKREPRSRNQHSRRRLRNGEEVQRTDEPQPTTPPAPKAAPPAKPANVDEALADLKAAVAGTLASKNDDA